MQKNVLTKPQDGGEPEESVLNDVLSGLEAFLEQFEKGDYDETRIGTKGTQIVPDRNADHT